MADLWRSALSTDLYQITMAAAYHRAGLRSRATFELFVRSLPPGRSYLVAAGLDPALEYLEGLLFTPEEIEYLRGHPSFEDTSSEFFEMLGSFQFTGDVDAMPEGTPAFAGEPILRVTAPIVEAQIVETNLLSLINFQTLIASKASRCCRAAGSRAVVEFGTRRAHGPEAGFWAARAATIGGCAGTSNVIAGQRLGIPTYGTAAHSFMMAFDSEEEAFRRYGEAFPTSSILLIDTYDTVEGAKRALRAMPRLKGVRLDSGDLLDLSLKVRRILDEGGRKDAMIFASGDLDEWKIDALLRRGAPIDAFGVGTDLATSRDSPALGGIYKLVEVEEDGKVLYRAKFSEGKATTPGSKQVYRFRDRPSLFQKDVIALSRETSLPDGERLLLPVLRKGERVGAPVPLSESKDRAETQVGALPSGVLRLDDPEEYPVEYSETLQSLLRDLRRAEAAVGTHK